MADSKLVNLKSPEKQASVFSCPGSLSCSVCLELITNVGERSIAKLKCGHHFHLDCIGSAFNAKGSMQCPNCRCVEEGQWLYRNGCHGFEDGLSYEDDFEVYAGVANLLHPSEELHISHLHGGAHSLLSHQHVSVTLEGGNPPASIYPDLVINMLYGEHGGSSNPVHTCPYLVAQRAQHPRQMQIFNGNVGIPHIHEMALHTPGGSHVGGNSARTQRPSIPNRTVWNSLGMGPLASSNGPLNFDYTEPPIFPNERARRSRRASGNNFHGNHDLASGQARLHQRRPDYRTGSSPMPRLMHNQGIREPVSSIPNAVSPALHNGLNATNQRSRFSTSHHSPDLFSDRRRVAPWNIASRVAADSAGGLPGIDATGWNGSAQGYLWQRDRNLGSPWGSYDSESRWHPWFHNRGTSQSYGDVTSSSYFENDFQGADGALNLN